MSACASGWGVDIYYVLLTRGILGTHVYAVNPEMRKYLSKFLPPNLSEAEPSCPLMFSEEAKGELDKYEGELNERATIKEFLTVQTEGTRQVERKRKYYRLDAIIAVGYRVNSTRAIQFRQWATVILSEYTIKGYALDSERMKHVHVHDLPPQSHAFIFSLAEADDLGGGNPFSCP